MLEGSPKLPTVKDRGNWTGKCLEKMDARDPAPAGCFSISSLLPGGPVFLGMRSLAPLQVSTGFQSNNMMSALPSNFLDRLLSTALMEDAEIRLFVLEILISFIDRHGNRHKFSTIR